MWAAGMESERVRRVAAAVGEHLRGAGAGAAAAAAADTEDLRRRRGLTEQLLNDRLAHEVILSPQQRLDRDALRDSNPMYRQVEGIFKKAFWDGIREELSGSPPKYDRVCAMIGEVRDSLVSLTRDRAVQDEIKEVLDTELLLQQLSNTTFDPEQFLALVAFLAKCVLDLEAPARNQATRDWVRGIRERAEAMQASPDERGALVLTLLPEAFEFVYNKVEQIRVDIANVQLDLCSQYLRVHGAAFERFRFAKRAEEDPVVLRATVAWLDAVLQTWRSEQAAAPLSPAGSPSPSSSPPDEHGSALAESMNRMSVSSPAAGAAADDRGAGAESDGLPGIEQIVRHGLYQLLQTPVALGPQQTPPPFFLDGPRLVTFQNRLQLVTLTAVNIHFVHQILRQSGVAPTSQDIATAKQTLLKVLSGSAPHLVGQELVKAVQHIVRARADRDMTEQEQQLLATMVHKSASLDDAVYKTINRRLMAVLGGETALPSDGDLRRVGLAVVAPEIRELSTDVGRMLGHNLAVYGSLYRSIVALLGGKR